MIDESFTAEIIAAAIEVHRTMGPGLLESVYEECLAVEMAIRGLRFERQHQLPVLYKGKKLHGSLRIDFWVDHRVVVELKAIDKLMPVHEAQLLTYLRLSGCRLGLLINFNVPALKDGIKRMVNGYSSVSPCLRG